MEDKQQKVCHHHTKGCCKGKEKGRGSYRYRYGKGKGRKRKEGNLQDNDKEKINHYKGYAYELQK